MLARWLLTKARYASQTGDLRKHIIKPCHWYAGAYNCLILLYIMQYELQLHSTKAGVTMFT